METASFALGMLAMVAIALLIVIVVGIVKVFKQQKEIKSTQEWLSSFERNVEHMFENNTREIDRRENNIYNTISDNYRDLHQMIEDKYTGAIGISNAYTDSRLDKLEQKLTGTSSTKQVIKG